MGKAWGAHENNVENSWIFGRIYWAWDLGMACRRLAHVLDGSWVSIQGA